jgi:hypothetical protein
MKLQHKRPVVYIELYSQDISSDDEQTMIEVYGFIDDTNDLSVNEEIKKENSINPLPFVKEESELESINDDNHSLYNYDFSEADHIPEIKVEVTDDCKHLIHSKSTTCDGNAMPYFIFKIATNYLSR